MDKKIEQKAEIAKQFFEKLFIECELQRYQAYLNKEEFYEYEFDSFDSIEWEHLDLKLQYFEDLEYHSRYGDRLSFYIYQIPIQEFTTITYRMKTDGDDGWIIIFSDIGELLAIGYTYIEFIEWESSKFISTHANNIDSSLLSFRENGNMNYKTFWGKSLKEATNIARQRLKNNIFA